MKANIGYALISTEVACGESIQIVRDCGLIAARLVELPFL
jgi:hypothetical protein